MRKISIYFISIFILTYIIFWFSGAYFLQKQAEYVLGNNSEQSFNVEYNKISVEGFPFRWVIRVMSPSITMEENLPKIAKSKNESNGDLPSSSTSYSKNLTSRQRFSAKIAQININLDASIINILVDKKLLVENLNDPEDKWSIEARYTPNLTLELKDSPIFFTTRMDYSIDYYLKNIYLARNQLIINGPDNSRGKFSDISFNLLRHYFDSTDISHIAFDAEYEGDIKLFDYKKISIDTELDLTQEVYSYHKIKKQNLRRASNISLDRIRMIFNATDSILARGEVTSYFGKMEPAGNIRLFLGGYRGLIDNLLPSKFLPASEVIRVIEKTNLLDNNRTGQTLEDNFISTRLRELFYYNNRNTSMDDLNPENDCYIEMNFGDEGISLSGIKLEDITKIIERD